MHAGMLAGWPEHPRGVGGQKSLLPSLPTLLLATGRCCRCVGTPTSASGWFWCGCWGQLGPVACWAPRTTRPAAGRRTVVARHDSTTVPVPRWSLLRDKGRVHTGPVTVLSAEARSFAAAVHPCCCCCCSAAAAAAPGLVLLPLTDGQGQVEVEQLSGLGSSGQGHDDVGHCKQMRQQEQQQVGGSDTLVVDATLPPRGAALRATACPCRCCPPSCQLMKAHNAWITQRPWARWLLACVIRSAWGKGVRAADSQLLPRALCSAPIAPAWRDSMLSNPLRRFGLRCGLPALRLQARATPTSGNHGRLHDGRHLLLLAAGTHNHAHCACRLGSPGCAGWGEAPGACEH